MSHIKNYSFSLNPCKISDAIKGLGGNIVGAGAVINIVELNNNKKVFSLIDVNESE